ncbi:MAG: hypothetical protein H0U74_13840 [Bradymonadaceae bacterium]|nr:hypothetical protein [Lujinxingiaceae bacterium]
MTKPVECPRCGQDWLVRVKLVALNRGAVRCPECEALWLTEEDIDSTTWTDYGTFMRLSGRFSPDQKGEIEILEPLTR